MPAPQLFSRQLLKSQRVFVVFSYLRTRGIAQRVLTIITAFAFHTWNLAHVRLDVS